MPVTQFPTFTIPTNRCCSLILPFADIATVLYNEPHIVQVSIGELEKNAYQLDLGIDWLHSPSGWPVYLTSFNPSNPVQPQVFQYDCARKKIQIACGPSRVSMSHEDILSLAEKAGNVTFVSLPVEEDGVVTQQTDSPAPKKKRKVARKDQSATDALEAIRGSSFTFVNKEMPSEALDNRSTLKFTPIINGSHSPDEILSLIKSALSDGADVIETDFPFHLAKLGWVLNSDYSLTDLKNSDKFHNHNPVVEFDTTTTPENVVEAGLHTFSYMHHLFRCDELSGPILLATINLFQFRKFVDSFRL
jgi:hypothetical protein